MPHRSTLLQQLIKSSQPNWSRLKCAKVSSFTKSAIYRPIGYIKKKLNKPWENILSHSPENLQ